MLTPLQAQLCEHWRGLSKAVQERAEEITRVEEQLWALKVAHAKLLKQAEALNAFLQICDLGPEKTP
jgi:hypothetical protein